MKKNKLYLFILLVILFQGLAQAGDKGGNGGGGIFCPGQSGEVYDLVEGRIRYRMDIPEIHGTSEFAIQTGLKKISKQFPKLAKDISLEVKTVKENIEFLSIKIERTLDADNIYVPFGCSYHQVANWDPTTDRLMASAKYWSLLSPPQQGVLILHEAVYSLYRKSCPILSNDCDSVEPVRKFIAEVFSNDPIVTKFTPEEDQSDFVRFSSKLEKKNESSFLSLEGSFNIPKGCVAKTIHLTVKAPRAFIVNGELATSSITIPVDLALGISKTKIFFPAYQEPRLFVPFYYVEYGIEIPECGLVWSKMWKESSTLIDKLEIELNL